MDHPDDSQVIRTRVRLSGPAHDYRHGSGYLVADTVALTARHVLTSDGMADGELAGQCEVKPYGAQEWIVAEVGPSDAATDVALLRVPSVHAAASAEFGRVGNDIVDWKAVGYPSAVKDDKGRSALAPFGRVEGSSLRDRCQLQLTVEAAAPTDHHGWLGMSGAVVFAGGRVIGVIIEDAPAFDSNALRAARAEDFLKISKISEFLDWDGYLHEVQATDTSVLASALSGPVVVGQIPQEPPSFQPRRELLTAMTGEPAERGSPMVFAVTGIRGVGKSQLAAAWARQRLTERWRVVAWVPADDQDQILAGFGQLAAALNLAEGVKDFEESAMRVRNWLEADGRRCLLVFDNAASADAVRPFLPAAGEARSS